MAGYLDFFTPEIDMILTKLKNSEGGFLIGEKVEEKLRESVRDRIAFVCAGYIQKQVTELLKDENPFVAADPRMITEQEREKIRPVLLKKLKTGEIILPESMQKLIKRVMQNFEDFQLSLFRNLSLHREEIGECIFGGRTYSLLTDYHKGGDSHNHGKYTVILETDIGKMVYKPHSCKVDSAAYTFMKRYFDDVICMPKAYAPDDEFGVVEFLEKRIAEGDEEAKRYYYNLGGTAAVIKALGSRDMHTENLFAVGDRLALIDIETLLYPEKKKIDYSGCVIYERDETEKLTNSLYGSSLINVRYENEKYDVEREFSILFCEDEEGSAPLVEGKRRTVHFYKDEFIKGFEDIYRRCVQQREEIKKDVDELFSPAVFRIIIGATQVYYEVTRRFNSEYRYESEEYYASQLKKLPEIFRKFRADMPEAVFESEKRSLLENDIPFFYTYGHSRGLWSEGVDVNPDYAVKSPVERTLKILDGMNEEEMVFEKSFMLRYMSMTKRKAESALDKVESEVNLTYEEAYSEAMHIMEQIYDSIMWLENGEPVWLNFIPGVPTPNFMDQGLYCGHAGLAVYFAAVLVTAEDESIKEKARVCLDSIIKRLDRFLSADLVYEKHLDESKFSVGEGSGLAGILSALIETNHIMEGAYSELVEKGKDLIADLDPGNLVRTDKAQGLAGLIVTICRYEELCSDERLKELVRRLADRLSELRTLNYRGEILWNTIDTPQPISGAVHGMMGIAEAFLLAGKLLGTDRYDADAEAALSFEYRSYNEKLMNWPDSRIPGNNKPSGGNCYGAEGMGIILHRLQQAGIDSELIDGLSEKAAAVVKNRDYYSLDHLCCGELSVVEYYLETGDLSSAEKRLRTMLRSKETNGVYRLGFAGCKPNNNVTLFYGLAGIGYELLRYLYPDRLPSVV